METTRGWKIIVILILLFSSSCRFKSPSIAEGQLLAKQGAFPSGLPGWVKPSDDMDAARVTREGLMPSNFSSTQIVKKDNARSPSQAISKAKQAQDAKAKEDFSKARAESNLKKDEELSPLDRIESVCPGLEIEVTNALKTVKLSQRISKYDSLTTRCSSSSDLWFWLAQDYQAAGKLPEAIRSFEQVLVLDPKNQAAQALLDEVRQAANTP